MGKLDGILSGLKKVKHIEIIAGGVLLVAVLVIYFCCVSCSSGSAEKSVDLGSADYCTSMQIQLENIVSKISGVGEASVVINWDKSAPVSFTSSQAENPQATGAVVVCDGGNSTKVKLDVIYAVSTLLNLSIDKIIVYPKSN